MCFGLASTHHTSFQHYTDDIIWQRLTEKKSQRKHAWHSGFCLGLIITVHNLITMRTKQSFSKSTPFNTGHQNKTVKKKNNISSCGSGVLVMQK